jgi:hypothetical protein
LGFVFLVYRGELESFLAIGVAGCAHRFGRFGFGFVVTNHPPKVCDRPKSLGQPVYYGLCDELGAEPSFFVC